LAAILSLEERVKASRVYVRRDRERAIVARSFLRQILAAYLQCTPDSIAFAYTANGKPHLAGDAPALRFNLSHSNALFLCAVSSHCEVGVDVERMGAMPEADAAAIVERFFTEGEKSAYQTAANGQKDLAFYKLWTRKEAIAKCSGWGIAQERGPQNFEGAMIDLTPAAGYIGSLAAQCPSCTVQTWRWPDCPD
jgi:4'-phosphopantetheinyl transferase